MSQKLSIIELREKIHIGQANDPLVFLEAIMTGQDPRFTSDLFNIVESIQDFTDGEPTPDDWSDLYKYVTEHMKYQEVTIAQSVNAAKSLSEYLHPKRKQIDVIGTINQDSAKIESLTIEEVELFKEKWNDEY